MKKMNVFFVTLAVVFTVLCAGTSGAQIIEEPGYLADQDPSAETEIAEAELLAEELEGTEEIPQDVQYVDQMFASSFSTNNQNQNRPQDEGHIYVGYSISDGQLDEPNSNWTGNTDEIVLDAVVEGAGFTAVRSFGDNSIRVSGTLVLADETGGQNASEFTGAGAAITGSSGTYFEVDSMDFAGEGFARSFAVLQDASMNVSGSEIMAMGRDPLWDSWDGYENTADPAKMISPPWSLGIQGGALAINLLGSEASLIIDDSQIIIGGWGCISTDGCEKPYVEVINSSMSILPESAGGMGSGWSILGYGRDNYGSGFGVYAGSNSHVCLRSTLVNGTTYGIVLAGGEVLLQGISAEDPTLVHSVFGIMADGSGTVSVMDDTRIYTAASSFLYKDGDSVWNIDGAELHPGNGVILQMIDNDEMTVGNADPLELYMEEEAGFPVAADEGDNEKNNVKIRFANGLYTGNIYNATGYYHQAADSLEVSIAENAELDGDIALSSCVHGMLFNGRRADDILAAVEEADNAHQYKDLDEIEYTLINASGQTVNNPQEAIGIQFTRFSILEYYLMGHVINLVHYNGRALLNVTVEGTWRVKQASLLTGLHISENAHVYGVVIELEDGSVLIGASENEALPGDYGAFAVSGG